jgi:hypothetical protein
MVCNQKEVEMPVAKSLGVATFSSEPLYLPLARSQSLLPSHHHHILLHLSASLQRCELVHSNDFEVALLTLTLTFRKAW